MTLLSVSSGLAAGHVVLPSYEEGNSWVYSANLTYTPGFVLDGTLEMRITDAERVYVDSTPYHTLRNEIIGDGTFIGVFEGHNVSGSWTMVGLENWDMVSLEIVRCQTTLVLRGLMDVGIPLNFYLSIQNTTFSDVALDAWQHPYDVGDSGNVMLARTSNETMLVEIEGSVPVHNSTDWNGSVAVTYSCVEDTEITVQAGVFQTHHILRTESNGLVEDNYYSDEVGAGVRIDRSLGGIVVIGQWELLSYTYAAAQSPDDEVLPLLYWLIPVAVVIALIIAALYFERRRK